MNKYYISNLVTGKVFGPYSAYITAEKKSSHIDDVYGEIVCEIHCGCNPVKRSLIIERKLFSH